MPRPVYQNQFLCVIVLSMDNITALFPSPQKHLVQVVFNRVELTLIMGLYGRFVSAGLLKDYAIRMDADEARFAAFKRAAERPDFEIVKRPDLARKQGSYALIGTGGTVLKRGHDLRGTCQILERRLMKLVEPN